MSACNRRGGHRADFTRIKNKIQALLDDNDMASERKIHDFEARIKELDDKVKIIDELNQEILNGTAEEAVLREMEEADEFSERVAEVRLAATYALRSLQGASGNQAAATPAGGHYQRRYPYNQTVYISAS